MNKAGPAKAQPARSPRGHRPAPGAISERRFSSMRSASASSVARNWRRRDLAGHRPLGDDAQLRAEPLPFGHLGRRPGALELVAEGGGVDVAGEDRRAPDAAPRRQVAGQLEEAQLDRRPGEELDQLPRRRLALRAGEDGQSGTARDRGAGTVGARKRRRHPVVLPLGRHPALELADVPRAADVEGEMAAGELVVEVGDLRVAERRRQPSRKRER